MRGDSGFSLMELLIYMGVFALVSIGLTTTFVAITRVQTEQSSNVNIDQESAFLLQKLQDYIANASVIDVPLETATSTLRLRTPALAADPTVITVAAGTVYVQQGTGARQPLTTSHVAVSNLTFTRHANPPGHDSVSLSFQISPVGSSLTNAITEAFRLSVARVSAASFDSDVVPSSTNLNLGVTGNSWNSVNNVIYFSGTKVGVNNNVPLQPLDVSGNAVTRGNLGINNTAPGALLDLKSLVAGTHPANTTLAVFRDYYNNGVNGQQLWMNAEGSGGSLSAINLTNDWGKLTFGAGGAGATVRDDLAISGGSVGIGTVSPLHKFEVDDAANSGMRVQTAISGGTVASFGGLGDFQIDSNGVTAGRFVVKENGNVGIGSSTPSSPFVITGTTQHLIPAAVITQLPGNPPCAGCVNKGLQVNVLDGTGSGKENLGLEVNVGNASKNYAAIFNGGSVAIGTTDPTLGGGVGSAFTIVAPGSTGIAIATSSTGKSFAVNPQADGSFVMFDGFGNAWHSALTVSNGNVSVNGGTGKITVGTVDPVYTINGDKFATYDPGMTGQKEETTDVAELSCLPASSSNCTATLDFSGPKGSDLWLFAQVTNLAHNFGKLVVLLTPSFDGRAWYTKDASGMKVTIHGDHAGEVSYRLSAPRFDAAAWPNATNDSAKGFIINN